MKSNQLIILISAVMICGILYSSYHYTQEMANRKLQAMESGLFDSDGNAVSPVDLANEINGKTTDEVKMILDQYNLEYDETMVTNNDRIQTQLYRQTLQSTGSGLYILALCGQIDSSWMFIAILDNGKAYENRGSIILSGGQTSPDAFRIEEDPASETVWIVVREPVEQGMGIHQYDEVWYRLSDRSLVRDLQYVAEKHDWVSPEQPYFYDLKGTASTKKHIHISESQAYDYYIDVQYEIKLTNSDVFGFPNEEDGLLFTAYRQLRYVWQPDENRFHLDAESSNADETLFDFSTQAILENYSVELEKLSESRIQAKLDWLDKLINPETNMNMPDVHENLRVMEFANLNDAANANVVLSLPEGFTASKRVFQKASNFEYNAEKNRGIDTVYTFQIFSTKHKDKFNQYGIEGLAGWFYDTSYYRDEPDNVRFPNKSVLKEKVFEGNTALGEAEIFILTCDIVPKELRTEEHSTYELVYAWIPIEDEDLAYNLGISVPLGEDSGLYVDMVKNTLQAQE